MGTGRLGLLTVFKLERRKIAEWPQRERDRHKNEPVRDLLLNGRLKK